MLSDASVTMNGCGTRPTTKTMPLARPTARPVPRIASTTSAVEWTCMYTIAPTTPESATVAPTDRSMPRLTITSSWPSASTAITAVCEKTFPRLRPVKKIGVVRLTKTISRNRISAGPARRASSAACSSR